MKDPIQITWVELSITEKIIRGTRQKFGVRFKEEISTGKLVMTRMSLIQGLHLICAVMTSVATMAYSGLFPRTLTIARKRIGGGVNSLTSMSLKRAVVKTKVICSI